MSVENLLDAGGVDKCDWQNNICHPKETVAHNVIIYCVMLMIINTHHEKHEEEEEKEIKEPPPPRDPLIFNIREVCNVQHPYSGPISFPTLPSVI